MSLRCLLVAFLFHATACSLVLEEHELPVCASHDDCAGLNDADAIDADACERWQCDGARDPEGGGLLPGRCVLRDRDDDSDEHVSAALCAEGDDHDDEDPTAYPNAREQCDGADNDGDSLIDEPNDGEPVIAPEPELLIEIDEVPITVRYAGRESDAAAVWVTEASGTETARFGWLSSGMGSAAPAELTLRVSEDNDAIVDPDEENLVRSSCYRWDGQRAQADRCYVLRAAIGITSEHVLTAVVAEVGRAEGQLRIGYAERNVASFDPSPIVRGPAARASSYLGIDLDESGRLSGGSRDVVGATQPALALLDDGDIPQALVAWLGDAPARSECGGEPVNVEALVAYLDHRSDVPFVATTTEQNGTISSSAPSVAPRVLGRTREGVAPAVAAWKGQGYFVAHGGDDSELSLHFVPAAPSPPGYLPSEAQDNLDAPREMPALPDHETWRIASLRGEPVHGVAVALGREHESLLELGVAWREGCGDEDTSIVFRRLLLSTEASALDLQQEDAGDTFALTEGSGPHGPPAIAYVASGMRTNDGAQGGFLVAFSERDRMLARRISEHDARLLDERERIELGLASHALIERPAWHETSEGIRAAFYSEEAGGIVTSTASCSSKAR